MKHKLMLCSGPHKEPGIMTLDVDPRCEPDILAQLPYFPLKSIRSDWDEIYLIHGIEHFYLWDAKTLARNVYGALRDGGTFIMEQPNLEFAAKVVLGMTKAEGDLKKRCGMWALYGSPENSSEGMAHRWAYTPDTLTDLLAECGFKRENIKRGAALSHIADRDFRIEATK